MHREAELAGAYKTCSTCGMKWDSFEELLLDPHVHLNGYQASFVNPESGLILFTHETDECGSTLALAAELSERCTRFIVTQN